MNGYCDLPHPKFKRGTHEIKEIDAEDEMMRAMTHIKEIFSPLGSDKFMGETFDDILIRFARILKDRMHLWEEKRYAMVVSDNEEDYGISSRISMWLREILSGISWLDPASIDLWVKSLKDRDRELNLIEIAMDGLVWLEKTIKQKMNEEEGKKFPN